MFLDRPCGPLQRDSGCKVIFSDIFRLICKIMTSFKFCENTKRTKYVWPETWGFKVRPSFFNANFFSKDSFFNFTFFFTIISSWRNYELVVKYRQLWRYHEVLKVSKTEWTHKCSLLTLPTGGSLWEFHFCLSKRINEMGDNFPEEPCLCSWRYCLKCKRTE